MSKQSKFAGTHTRNKLDALENYLRSYQKVFKNTDFQTIFFDAFAGTGSIHMDVDDGGLLKDVDDFDEIVVGSACRALSLAEPFSKYVFVELHKGKTDELRQRVAVQFEKLASRIEIRTGDANEEVVKFCSSMTRNMRAVIFLDPFGNQVSWETICAIAATQKVDLWYLFPAQLGINRQISNSGEYDEDKARSLDKVLGTPTWRDVFVKREIVEDLFESRESAIKQADADRVTEFMIERMKTVFKGGVLPSWLPLGRNGQHWYSLLFACANPNQKANEVAMRIASHIMRRTYNGRRL